MEEDDRFSTGSSVPSEKYSVGKLKLLKVEVILCLIGSICFIIFLTIAILLGAGVGSKDTETIEPHENIVQVKIHVKPLECLTPECLEASASLVYLRDKAVDPCFNFYQYACSSKVWSPKRMKEDEREFSTFHQLRQENEERVRNALGTQIRRTVEWSSETKMKTFYQSCLDTYGNSIAGSRDFMEKVLTPSGGWNVIGTMMEERYEISEALKKVHSDFWMDALFSIRVSPDQNDFRRNILEIGLGGLTLRWWDYVGTTAKHQKLFEDTKKFMQTVGRLVIRDSGQVSDEAEMTRKADEFAEDVFNFELQLANQTWYTLPSDDPHAHENRVTIAKMNDISDEFDWVDILTTMYSSANVNANTKIVLLEKEFLGKLNELVKNLPDRKRTLNNYFTWRLMLGYVTDLGWEYVHANREFYVARTGLTEFTGIPTYCFNKVKHHFRDGLGALYIRDHLLTSDKDTIHNIVAYLKKGLQDRLDQLTWMETSSKQIAVKKVKAIVEKLGYPQWMADNDVVDQKYQRIKIERDQYLENLIEIGAFEREKANHLLLEGEDKALWTSAVWDTNNRYDQIWNEILITAGLLQWPIYARDFPKYYNFGALGITLAHELSHAVDEIGGYYLPNGTYFDWWTRNTTIMYNTKRACLEGLDITAGPYQVTPDSEIINIRIDGAYVARELAAEMAAIRIAYNAYKDWVNDNEPEKVAPGVGLTNEQTMFLAYAQTQCFVRRDEYSISRAERQLIPEDIRLNQALAHTPEFVEAFSCDAHTNMHAEDMCEVF